MIHDRRAERAGKLRFRTSKAAGIHYSLVKMHVLAREAHLRNLQFWISQSTLKPNRFQGTP